MHTYECGEQGARDVTKYEAIWDYNVQPKEASPYCNLCGESNWFGTDISDRYGYRIGLARCRECGLFFLAPRMTREAYARFYESGAYRRLVSAFHGRDVMETIEQEQCEYGHRLVDLLQPWQRFAWTDALSMWSTALDIGGSTGMVAKVISERMGLDITVLEPSVPEGMAAAGRRLTVVPGTIEDLNTDKWWDLITLCQTADHLLDLMGSLRKIKSLLSPEGLFWSDIVDFDVTREVKIDHPFNLTERTYRMFLEKAGFKLLQINYAPDGRHIGFLCRAAE